MNVLALASTFPFSDYLLAAIFLVFVATTVGGALVAALTTRIIRSVSGLALCCIGLAGLYYFLNSPFLALMEILIYVGAVCVTIVFGVMLSETDEVLPERYKHKPYPIFGLLIAAAVAGAVFLGITKLDHGVQWPNPVAQVTDGSIAAIGNSLLTTYSMAFELISLVLLVAILGALAIARGGREKK